VKAANLLIDDDGTVLLGDLGVATFLWDSEETTSPALAADHRRMVSFDPNIMHDSPPHVSSRPRFKKRKSFVGTASDPACRHGSI
jgi:serine/threonine-protein kinase OSR1/STK39